MDLLPKIFIVFTIIVNFAHTDYQLGRTNAEEYHGCTITATFMISTTFTTGGRHKSIILQKRKKHLLNGAFTLSKHPNRKDAELNITQDREKQQIFKYEKPKTVKYFFIVVAALQLTVPARLGTGIILLPFVDLQGINPD